MAVVADKLRLASAGNFLSKVGRLRLFEDPESPETPGSYAVDIRAIVALQPGGPIAVLVAAFVASKMHGCGNGPGA